MKAFAVCLFWGCVLTQTSFAQKLTPIQSQWTTETINPADSGAAVPKVDARVKVVNNAKDLLLTIRLSKEADQVKALVFGSTIWLDGKGKKTTKHGIQFPIPEDRSAGPPPGLNKNPDRNAMKQFLIDRKTDMNLIGLAGADEEGMLVQAKGDPSGIRGSLSLDYGVLVYNLTIPLALFETETDDAPTVAIGFETNQPQTPKAPLQNNTMGNNMGMGGMSSRRGYGGGGMYGGGGGMYGGGMGYGGGGMSRGSGYTPTRFWLAITLAKQ